MFRAVPLSLIFLLSILFVLFLLDQSRDATRGVPELVRIVSKKSVRTVGSFHHAWIPTPTVPTRQQTRYILVPRFSNFLANARHRASTLETYRYFFLMTKLACL
jgi:hypothetical protein